MVQISRSRNSSSGNTSFFHFIVTALLCAISFYTGNLSSFTTCDCPLSNSNTNVAGNSQVVEQKVDEQKIEAIVQQRLQAELSKAKQGGSFTAQKETTFFPHTTSKYLNGVTRIPRDDYLQTFDFGNPYVKSDKKKNDEVLLFYNTHKAFPSSEELKQQVQYDNGSGIGTMDASSATENCDTMNVVQVGNPGNTRQCLAIVGDYESYHVQRWMRVAPSEGDSRAGKMNINEPLRPVSRGHMADGGDRFRPPTSDEIRKHWGMLGQYFGSFDEKIVALKAVAEKVAVKNTIIVMTCNMGQSELLMNFVCNAKSKGLDVSNVLVFPTDQETKDLAEGLGLATFYDEETFADTPTHEANFYMDKTFVALMLAKVVCVQMINHLGYDLLFQDVDMVWYKNPLEYFHDENNQFREFDMYFQDDGARSSRYAPLSANSGFYYVRNNARTRYLFTSLLYGGDMILQTKSHQAALVQLLNEHISYFGLKVKVLNRDMDEFPGGWHYHKKNKSFMMSVVKEEVSPIIFHMSWTKNKDNKVKYFQQMGQWYVNDMCIAHTKGDIMGNHDMKEGDSLVEPCCLVEPNIVCHYRDKPSKIPCRDVDPIDKGRPSFW